MLSKNDRVRVLCNILTHVNLIGTIKKVYADNYFLVQIDEKEATAKLNTPVVTALCKGDELEAIHG